MSDLESPEDQGWCHISVITTVDTGHTRAGAGTGGHFDLLRFRDQWDEHC